MNLGGPVEQKRPTRDDWAMKLAHVTAERATCHRRRVGCVLLDARGHVLGTGYNGVARGMVHCTDNPDICPGSRAPSGTQLDGCHAIHAEQNALLQCRDVYAIHTAFVTVSPCMTCVKLLMNTSCERIVFAGQYPHADAATLWRQSGRTWEQLA